VHIAGLGVGHLTHGGSKSPVNVPGHYVLLFTGLNVRQLTGGCNNSFLKVIYGCDSDIFYTYIFMINLNLFSIHAS
jgi:hypothetical protein